MAAGRDYDPLPRQCIKRWCNYLIAPDDEHTCCVLCLGLAHARDAFEVPGFCPSCTLFSAAEKGRRLGRVRSYLEEHPMAGDGRPRPLAEPRPSTSSQQFADNAGCPPPVWKASRPGPGYDSTAGEPSTRRQPEASFPYDSFGSEQSFRPDLCSSLRQDYAPTPFGCQLPADRPTWGSRMDLAHPTHPIQAPPQEPPEEEEFRVIDQVGYDLDDIDADVPAEMYGEDGELLEDRDGGDGDPPRAGVPCGAEGGAPPQAREGDAPVAPVVGADPDGEEVDQLVPADWDLLELLRRAAIRTGRTWPEAAPQPDPEDSWPGADIRAPRRRAVLPLAQGFKACFTANWQAPTSAPPTMRNTKVPFDTVAMNAAGLGTLPTVGPVVGAYLMDPSAPNVRQMAREPVLPEQPRKASIADAKLYGFIASAGKHLNTISLLQQSLTHILEGSGEAPLTPRKMAEVKRIHGELIKFSCSATALVGRAGTAVIMAERARWLDSHPRLDALARELLWKCPIQEGGLFEGALKGLAITVEEHRPGIEALAALVPRQEALQQVPRAPQVGQRQQWPRARRMDRPWVDRPGNDRPGGQQPQQRPRQPRAGEPESPPRARPAEYGGGGGQQRGRGERRRPPAPRGNSKAPASRAGRAQQRK